MTNILEWSDYKNGAKPSEFKLYLVHVNNSIGGNYHQYLAQFRIDQSGNNIFSSRDAFIPDDLFDKAVTHWCSLPGDPK